MHDTTPALPGPDAIHAAARRLTPWSIRTPLMRLHGHTGPGEIYLKLENLQAIGAYKVRSMGNVLLGADPASLRDGVYTASSGNAGVGLAWMAARLGVPARVYVTADSPAAKLDRIRRSGADIQVLSAEDWWQIIERRGHPTDPGLYVDAVRDPRALAGNATIGIEIVEQLPGVDRIIAPFGGGGVACGIAAALRALQPGAHVVIAESDAATPATAALRAGRPVEVAMAASFITGAGAPHVLEEMWPLIRSLIAETRVVPVADVAAAIRHLAHHNHVVAEGAGAIPVAAALADHECDGITVCVVTGGNIDAGVLAKILRREM